jgi:ubiquinone biosynthesis UbiH/UbiF/VisC/COQ6 family hydroxylase
MTPLKRTERDAVHDPPMHTHHTPAAATVEPGADVLIVGAGPAGLSLAAALADEGLEVHVLEQLDAATLVNPPDDGREIALTHRAREVMQALGQWARLPAQLVSPLREARVQDGNEPAEHLRFAANDGAISDDDIGPLGWLVPNHAIRRAAYETAAARVGVRVECGVRVTGFANEGDAARLTLEGGRNLRAALVVAADSRFSGTRRLAGIGASMRDFGRTVVVGPVSHRGDHGGIARECFRYGNTLALLPMSGRRVSAVVTISSEQAPEWMALDDAAFAARVQSQCDARLGAMQSAGPRHAYPLVGVYSQRFVAPRFALVGDAAVGMHPVTAHGFNFGLYSVQVLARQLKAARQAGRDIGALSTLQPYEAEHRRVTWPIYHGTNAVVQLFTDDRTQARWLRRAVLTVAEKVPPFNGLVHAAITRQLTGRAGNHWPWSSLGNALR